MNAREPSGSLAVPLMYSRPNFNTSPRAHPAINNLFASTTISIYRSNQSPTRTLPFLAAKTKTQKSH